MMIFIAIILFFIPLIWKLNNNFNKWIKNTPVNHKKEWRIVALAEMCTAGLLFMYLSDKPWYWSTAYAAGMMGFWFWLLFDGFYNLLRKRYIIERYKRLSYPGQYGFWFTGSDDKGDATTDNFLQKLKLWQHISIKIGGALLFTFLYFYK